MSKINISPKEELFKWGPIGGKPLYADFFNIAFTLNYKKYVGWPDALGYLYPPDKMLFILSYKNLYQRTGLKNFYKYILPNKQFKKNYKLWQEVLRELITVHNKIINTDLNKLTIKDLKKLYLEWTNKYLNFWAIGQLPEHSNWGGEYILKTKLEKILKPKDFALVYEKISAPEKFSFYQEEELDLLKLKKYSLNHNKELLNKHLKKHQQKYFWILNSYSHSQILPVSYFKKELSKFTPKQAKKKIKKLENFGRTVRLTKRRIFKKYKLPKNILKIANRITFCIWWQDHRKYYIFQANYILDLFLKQLTKLFKINFTDLHYYKTLEIEKLLKTGKKISSDEIKKRKNAFLFHYSEQNNKLYYFSGKKAKQVIKKYLKQKINTNSKTIIGLVVSRGKTVTGKAKIIFSPKEASKMKKGDILVAPMTSPDYILAIKKASAIITDTGGITSHAAIVSRELKIPCIVNTKHATQIIKNGQKIEVDTNKGLIKLL